jgi:hypothetical protein
MLQYVLDQLQTEYYNARPYMDKELQDSLRAIIERINILYGQSPDLVQVIGVAKVEKWTCICDTNLDLIKRAQKSIQKTLAEK